jgi:hypothetical protein
MQPRGAATSSGDVAPLRDPFWIIFDRVSPDFASSIHFRCAQKHALVAFRPRRYEGRFASDLNSQEIILARRPLTT